MRSTYTAMHKLITVIGILFFIFILWIIYLANTGNNSVFFSFVKTIPLGDKLGHFLLFGSLTFIGIIVLKFRTFSIGSFNIYYSVALVSVFVICEEFSQKFLSYRTFDFLDLIADLLGIIIAAAIAYLINKKTTISS